MAYVRAEHVWKRFILQHNRADSVGQLLLRMVPRRGQQTTEPFWALQDVCFEMPHGRSMGIIGHNGAGKSTLLKILTRTLQPTAGSLALRGRVSALIELGAGFHPDFTGRENIILNASILGIGRREVERRMDDIIEFSGIAPFIDTPVKYYSSGMHARLGFSVAIHVDPEILLVDEVLAVGDATFQQQCMERIFRLKRAGVSILLVSHDLGSVERLMDDALWLDHGRVRRAGRPRTIIQAYRDATEPSVVHSLGPGERPMTAPGPHIVAVSLLGHGRTTTIAPLDPLTVQITVDNPLPAAFLGYIAVTIRRPDGLIIADCSAAQDGAPSELPAETSVRADLLFDMLPLAAGAYDVDVNLLNAKGMPVDAVPAANTFHVVGGPLGPVVALPHRWSHTLATEVEHR